MIKQKTTMQKLKAVKKLWKEYYSKNNFNYNQFLKIVNEVGGNHPQFKSQAIRKILLADELRFDKKFFDDFFKGIEEMHKFIKEKNIDSIVSIDQSGRMVGWGIFHYYLPEEKKGKTFHYMPLGRKNKKDLNELKEDYQSIKKYFEGKNVFVVDEYSSSGQVLGRAKELFKQLGAKSVFTGAGYASIIRGIDLPLIKYPEFISLYHAEKAPYKKLLSFDENEKFVKVRKLPADEKKYYYDMWSEIIKLIKERRVDKERAKRLEKDGLGNLFED